MMESVRVSCLLFLLCFLPRAELQVEREGLWGAIRDMQAKLAELQLKVEQVQKEDQGLTIVDGETVYHYIDQQMTWDNARQHCRERYDDLATLQNEADVRKLSIPALAWIGLSDDPASWKGAMTSDSNSWRWSATGSTSPGGYQNWAPNEPNNGGGIEHCVYVQNGLWIDYKCSWPLHFVCYTVQPSGRKIYIPITTAKPWHDAQAYCRQYYHDLATIDTYAENQDVTSVLATNTTSLWIGLHRTPFRWSDGSPSTYRNWPSGEPDNAGGSEFCVTQSSKYIWNDTPCHNRHGFVCQSVKTTRNRAKIVLKTTANISDPTFYEKFQKVVKTQLGYGFSLSWSIQP